MQQIDRTLHHPRTVSISIKKSNGRGAVGEEEMVIAVGIEEGVMQDERNNIIIRQKERIFFNIIIKK